MKYYLSVFALVFTFFAFSQNERLESARYQVKKGKYQAYSIKVKLQNLQSQYDVITSALYEKEAVFGVDLFGDDMITIKYLSSIDEESLKDLLKSYSNSVDLFDKKQIFFTQEHK